MKKKAILIIIFVCGLTLISSAEDTVKLTRPILSTTTPVTTTEINTTTATSEISSSNNLTSNSSEISNSSSNKELSSSIEETSSSSKETSSNSEISLPSSSPGSTCSNTECKCGVFIEAICYCYPPGTRCQQGYKYSFDTCSCIKIENPSTPSFCPISKCKCGEIDSETCSCIQPSTDCLSGYFDYDTCSCTQIDSISSGEESNSSSSSDITKCEKQCYVYDHRFGACRSTIECFPNFALTEDGCRCFCPLEQSGCPSDTELDQKQCVCSSVSSSEYIEDSSIVFLASSIDEPSSSEETSPSSICPITECNYGLTLNTDDCSCYCPLSEADCTGNQFFNSYTCQCIEKSPSETYFDDFNESPSPESSSCHITNCVHGFILNVDDCSCKCSLSEANCKGNEFFEPNLCQCIHIDIFICPINPSNCPIGTQLDEVACECIPMSSSSPESSSISSDETWSWTSSEETSSSSSEEISSSEGTYYDPLPSCGRCEASFYPFCYPIRFCAPNFILDDDCNCACSIKASDCPPGTELDEVACNCKPVSDSSSEETSSSYYIDIGTCPSQDCAPGSQFDINVCYCVPVPTSSSEETSSSSEENSPSLLCSLTQADCTENEFFEPFACQCMHIDTSPSETSSSSEETSSSNDGTIIDDSFLFECKQKCYAFDFNANGCHPISQCHFSSVLNEDDCSCYCPLEQSGCPPNTELDQNQCVCNPISSSIPELSSETSCDRCEIPYFDYCYPVFFCSPNFISGDDCRCVCRFKASDCPPGTELDEILCECKPLSIPESSLISSEKTSSSSSEETTPSSFCSLTESDCTENSYLDSYACSCIYYDNFSSETPRPSYSCERACSVFDYNFGECRPYVQCSPNFALTDDGCSCYCPLEQSGCPPNTELDQNQCVCNPVSIPESSETSSPYCSLTAADCKGNEFFLPDRCECWHYDTSFGPSSSSSEISTSTSSSVSSSSVCHSQICAQNQEWSQDSCSCVCRDKFLCPIGFIRDQLTCKCIPEHRPTCPSHYNYDADLCICVCDKYNDCPQGRSWDNILCKCKCAVVKNCSTGTVWSDDECDCVCDEKVCEEGYILDYKTCQCVPGAYPECPRNFIYDPKSCECVCAEVYDCNELEVFDSDTCSCVCPSDARRNCKKGLFNSKECKCYE